MAKHQTGLLLSLRWKTNCAIARQLSGSPVPNAIGTNALFGDLLAELDQSGGLETMRCLDGHVLLALDGTEIHCPNCSHRKRGKAMTASIAYYIRRKAPSRDNLPIPRILTLFHVRLTPMYRVPFVECRMPARIVVVHDDPEFVASTVAALRAAGHDVVAYTSSMSAIEALEAAQRIEVLITRVMFPEGQPNGISLARMALTKKVGVKILFAALPGTQEFTEGVGEFLPAPVEAADIVARVETMLTSEKARERC
jgi:CheY-like chemotaxis protein